MASTLYMVKESQPCMLDVQE